MLYVAVSRDGQKLGKPGLGFSLWGRCPPNWTISPKGYPNWLPVAILAGMAVPWHMCCCITSMHVPHFQAASGVTHDIPALPGSDVCMSGSVLHLFQVMSGVPGVVFTWKDQKLSSNHENSGVLWGGGEAQGGTICKLRFISLNCPKFSPDSGLGSLTDSMHPQGVIPYRPYRHSESILLTKRQSSKSEKGSKPMYKQALLKTLLFTYK